MRCALGLALLSTVAAASPAAAQLRLEPVGPFTEPVHVASPPADPRVFVVEQDGLVKIAGRGTFLDVRRRVGTGPERGLLSIAFPPDYARSGRFYVFLTTRGTPYDLRVLEYRRSGDPDRADPGSARNIVAIPHPGSDGTHNGGQLQFGPGGRLYIGTGDGGGIGDPFRNAQDLDSELGKLLRVDARTGAPARGNPFGTRIWAYGLRNPWRFSFDRGTGDLWIGDVGQGAWEEIDHVARGRGANFGWPCREGSRAYAYRRSGCRAPRAVAPVLEHAHEGFCSVTGGYVVRDPGLPTLAGRYLYADFCHPQLRSVATTGLDDRPEPLPIMFVSSFGEDACGRIYVATLGGRVFRLQEGAPTPCDYPVPADRAGPGLRVAVRSRIGRGLLRVAVRCDEPCRATISTRVRGEQRSRRVELAAAQRTVVRIAIGRHARTAIVRVRAVDANGNVRLRTRRARVRR